MMNKKGQFFSGPVLIVVALIMGITFLTFGIGGGLKTTFNIAAFISSIPAPIWVALIFFFLIAGRRKKR